MGKMMSRLMSQVSSLDETKQKEAKKEMKQDVLPTSLRTLTQQVKQKLGNSDDLIIREFVVHKDRKAALFFTDGLTNTDAIQEIIEHLNNFTSKEVETSFLIDFYKAHSLAIGEIKEIRTFQDFYFSLLSGETIFAIDEENKALSFGTKEWQERAVNEPTTQTVVRGPKESFTENIRTNTALIRRKIKSPELWSERFSIGKQTNTPVIIMYMNNIVNPKVVQEVRERIQKIEIDSVLESGMLEEVIEDEPFSIVPTIYSTERPDTIASGLLEGRVAILVDGSPFVLLVPTFFAQFFQVSEDFYDRFSIATFTRMIRFLCLFISIGLLPLYISLISFHQEALPTPFLNSLAEQRERVPFPSVIESMFLLLAFEILREAGVRMPRVIGPAISIVGGLVLGQAAVEAGFVSASIVILVAMVALTDFVIPITTMSDAIKIYRYALLLLASSFGMYGLALGIVAIVLQLCSLRSFGYPFLAPMGPFIEDQKDTVIRIPLWAKKARPKLMNKNNVTREQTEMPSPSENNKHVWKRKGKG